MNDRDPGCKPFGSVAVVDVGAGKRLFDSAVGADVVPFEIYGIRIYICRLSRDLDELRCSEILLRHETLENLQIGDVHINLFNVWLYLFV